MATSHIQPRTQRQSPNRHLAKFSGALVTDFRHLGRRAKRILKAHGVRSARHAAKRQMAAHLNV